MDIKEASQKRNHVFHYLLTLKYQEKYYETIFKIIMSTYSGDDSENEHLKGK